MQARHTLVKPCVRAGQLGDGCIRFAAVVEERHDGQKATATELKRVEAHLGIPRCQQDATLVTLYLYSSLQETS